MRDDHTNSAIDVSDIVLEARRFIKNQLKITYLLSGDDKIFLDSRFDPEDILLLLHHLCSVYGLELKSMNRFDGDFTVKSISLYIAENLKKEND